MAHDRNTNEPHARQKNPHDHGLKTPQPKRSKLRQTLFILIPLGFLLLIGGMLLVARMTDSTPHSGAQAPPALQDQAPRTPRHPPDTAPAPAN